MAGFKLSFVKISLTHWHLGVIPVQQFCKGSTQVKSVRQHSLHPREWFKDIASNVRRGSVWMWDTKYGGMYVVGGSGKPHPWEQKDNKALGMKNIPALTITQLPRLRCWSSAQKFKMLSSAVCCHQGPHQRQRQKVNERETKRRGQLDIKGCHCLSWNTDGNLGYRVHRCHLMSPQVLPPLTGWVSR